MSESTALTPTKNLSPIESALVCGDLAKLTVPDRLAYVNNLCESLGLNPLTQPFEYITFQGKLTLYARRACTEQLRKLHNVSVIITSREKTEDLYIVTAKATLPDGRTDESIGAVSLGKAVGDNLANAIMKCETKAKRRVTLSICGLGFLDESETDTIKGATPMGLTGENPIPPDQRGKPQPPPAEPAPEPPPQKPANGQPHPGEDIESRLVAAANIGHETLKAAYMRLSETDRKNFHAVFKGLSDTASLADIKAHYPANKVYTDADINDVNTALIPTLASLSESAKKLIWSYLYSPKNGIFRKLGWIWDSKEKRFSLPARGDAYEGAFPGNDSDGPYGESV